MVKRRLPRQKPCLLCDGDQDLYVTNLGPNVCFSNEGNGKSAQTSILARHARAQCCSAVDYHDDGDMDLLISAGRLVTLEEAALRGPDRTRTF